MSSKIEVAVDSTSFTLTAGDTAEVVTTLRNLGQSVDQLTLSIEMLDPEWYSLPVSSVALFPNDQDNLRIILHPPKTAEAKPGSYPFRVKVVSQENVGEEAIADLSIEIQALPGVELDLSPESITGWRGVYNIQVDNPGDVEAVVHLSANDAENRLRYRLQPETLTVASGKQETATLEVMLGWLSFLGGMKEFDYQILASVAEAEEAKSINGKLVRRPSYTYVPKIRVPLLKRRPNIDTFEVTTPDRRDFQLRWSVKRATEVKLGDENVEPRGERMVNPAEAMSYVLSASNKHGVSSQTVNVDPLPIPKARVSERIRALLSPTSHQVTAGGVPVQATLELQNLSDVVDKFSVEVEGIDESWCSRSASSIALMPQATDKVTISFQPPEKRGVRAKTYTFAVVVQSQNIPEEATAILGDLEVLPSVRFKLAVRPYRVTGRRKGKYRVNLINTNVSNADVRLEATDLDEGLKFLFEDETIIVPAWDTIEIPVVAKPKRGSMIGEGKRYDITVTATDTTDNSQTANCELYHNPFIRSWRTIFRTIRILLVLCIVGALIGFLIHWGGGWRLLTQSPQTWWSQLVNQITRTFGGLLFR